MEISSNPPAAVPASASASATPPAAPQSPPASSEPAPAAPTPNDRVTLNPSDPGGGSEPAPLIEGLSNSFRAGRPGGGPAKPGGGPAKPSEPAKPGDRRPDPDQVSGVAQAIAEDGGIGENVAGALGEIVGGAAGGLIGAGACAWAPPIVPICGAIGRAIGAKYGGDLGRAIYNTPVGEPIYETQPPTYAFGA